MCPTNVPDVVLPAQTLSLLICKYFSFFSHTQLRDEDEREDHHHLSRYILNQIEDGVPIISKKITHL